MPDLPTPQQIYEEGCTRGHARLSASAAHRWLICPGSVKAQEGLPRSTSDASDMGTAAHALLEWSLRSSVAKGEMVKCDPATCGEKVGPWPVEDLAWAVNQAVEWTWALYSSLLDPEIYLEADLPVLPKLHPDLGGTCDIIILDRITMQMWVIDYKNGRGVVSAERNPQLGLYAIGFPDSEDYKVTLVILQPNTDGHLASEWACSHKDLDELAAKAVAAADLSRQDNPPRVYDKHGCHFCRATDCRERHRDFEIIPEPIRPVLDPSACSLATLRAIKDKAEEIQDFLRLVDAEIIARFNAGVPPEELGWKLVTGEGRSAYDEDNTEALEALAKALVDKGVQPFEEPKLIGITKARRALGKAGEHLVDAAVHRPPGKPKLVPVSDSRSSVGPEGFEVVDD